MAEQKGFLTAIAEPLAEAAAQHRASSPRDKSFTRAGGGAFLLTCCAYAAVWSPVFLGDHFDTLIAAFLRSPMHPPVSLLVWAGVTAFGLLWLWVGCTARAGRAMSWRRSGRPSAWRCSAAPSACNGISRATGAAWCRSPISCCMVFISGCWPKAAVHFLLAMRGMPGDAQRNVRQHIEQNQVVWRSARRK